MPMRSWLSRTCFAAAAAAWLATGVGARGDVKPFPDDWFYDGSKRAATLKGLEGKPVTEISAQTWIGESVAVKQQRGKVVVIDFWATWCGPCIAAIPENVQMVARYKDRGLVFVGVHDSSVGWDKAAGVVKDKGINYPVAHDKAGGVGVTAGAYQVQFWPTYVVIDRSGTIRGAGLTPGHVEDAVKLLLAEDAPEATLAASEFAAEFFYGGETRPAMFKGIEGKPAPAVQAAGWALGDAVTPEAWKDRVVVVHFFSPTSPVSARELEKLAAAEKELSAQGVLFVAICDGRATAEQAKAAAKTAKVAMPIAIDKTEPVTPAADGRAVVPTRGATASAYGVSFAPATVVVDRSGRVRAAGVKADKIKAVAEKLLAEAAGQPAGQPKAGEEPKP